ncbi:MAG TPA: ABC transporter permease [Verrucomicrobiae bacterium]|nr:ABC transporter permease [Verrucomicrobiae bacterium]
MRPEHWLHTLPLRLRSLFHRNQVEQDLSEELQYHLEQKTKEYTASGMAPEEARRKARREFGGIEQTKEICRDTRRVSLLETLSQDVRFGLRMLRKSPGFTAVAVLTLALGIGATTAVFSLVSAILLKPLPFPNPDQIVLPELVSPPGVNLGSDYFPWSQTQFRFLAQDSHPFHAVAAFQNDSFNLTGTDVPSFLDGFRVSAEFFPALGISPALGRGFTAEEDRPGHEYEVVLSDRMWREYFGANRAILGKAVRLNGYAYTVVGVMPAGFVFPRAEELPSSFNFPREAQLWVPLAIPEAPKNGPSELAVIARVKPGLTIQQAQAGMDLVTKHAEAKDPQWKGWFNSRVVPLTRQVVGDTERPLQLILAAVGIVLLIACSNIANLLLTRSFGRRREFTLRTALGAGRARLIRQLLTESLLIAVSAGAISILLANAGIYFVKTFGPADLPRLREVTLDLPVFAFALCVSLATGILFGLAPAIGATRENLADSLKEGSQRSGLSPTSPRLRNALLVSQVALALVLVISAGLLTRTFFHLLGANGGFNPDRVLTFQLPLPALKYVDQDHIVVFYQNALGRLRSVPGVQSAGIGETVPMGGEGESTVIRMPDHPAATQKELPFANYTIISPGYLSAVGTPVLRGRDFVEADTADSMPVALVNVAMEKKYWPGQSALGKQVGPGSVRLPLLTIVGVVPDVKHISFREETAPEMYVVYTQRQWPSMLNLRVALRTKADPASMTASVREAIHSIDPDLPLAKVATLTTLVDDSLSQPRFAMLLLASFGVLALLLASTGMYGVISYSVAQRTQEIGIRMALGAERRNVFGMVLSQGARLAGLGIALGLVAALGVTRLMASFLYGVQPADPLTFAIVSLLLVGTALLACYLPARGATRVDPLVALRHE